MQFRRLPPISTGVAWVLLLLLAPPSSALQQGSGAGGRGQQIGGGRGGGGRAPRATIDLATAQKALLEKDPPLERDFSSFVQAVGQESTNRKLPSFMEDPEATYGPEQRALRAECYGPLLENPRTRAFMRGLARKASLGGFDFTGATAALVLADAPDADDLAALWDGYNATGPDQRSGIARQLGRAIAAMKGADPRAPLVDEALARLKSDAAEGRPGQRGAAIEGLFRADEADEAIRVLKPLLSEEHPALETVTVLQACSRLFQRKDLDPFMKARAIATAETAVTQILGSDEEIGPTQVISGDGRTLRASIAFLQDVGGAGEFDMLLSCLDSERAQRLLGMDGLQNLRFGLQRRRGEVDAVQGVALDERWLKVLVDAGARLFALEEEPMDQEEQRAFWDARDLRYNALSYFCDQFLRAPTRAGSPPVKERLGKEPDLPAYLAAIFHAAEDVTEDGENGAVRYVAVADKLENRVMALQLLALIQREWNRDPAGLDLFAEAYALLANEIQAPVMVIEKVVAFRASQDPAAVLDVPIIKPPADPFVQGACNQTIADLGHIVHTTPTSIRIEIDAEHPWPWPRNGAPAPAPPSGE